MQPGRKCLHVIALTEVLKAVGLPEPALDPHPWDRPSMTGEDVSWAMEQFDREEAEPLPAYRDEW
jgi:hypothetical protein